MKNRIGLRIGNFVAIGTTLVALAGNALAQETQFPTLGNLPLPYALKMPNLSSPVRGSNLITQDQNNGTSIKLGSGLSLTLTSSVYDLKSIGGANSVFDPLERWTLNGQATGARILPNIGPRLEPSTNFNSDYRGNYASSVGGKVSMDLGRGLAFNVNGSVTRIPTAFDSPMGLTRSGARAETWSNVGAGMTMDLGEGSSISLTGSISKVSGSQCGFTFGACR